MAPHANGDIELDYIWGMTRQRPFRLASSLDIPAALRPTPHKWLVPYAIHSLLTDERKRTPLLLQQCTSPSHCIVDQPLIKRSAGRRMLVDPPWLKKTRILCEPRLVNFVHVFFFRSFANAILFYECGFRLDKFSQ